MAFSKTRFLISNKPSWNVSDSVSFTPSIPAVDSINPVKLSPLLYFLADTGVTTDGGAVSAWTQVTGTGMGGALSRSLAQGTGSLQPAHDTTDNHLTFDSADDKLVLNSAVTQAGIQIIATSNGIFAYEVDADSVDEITALGWEKGYFQGIDLYAYILLPTATTSDEEVRSAIEYLASMTGATKNPTGDLTRYWRNRTDLVTPKFDALDFSGATNFNSTWQACTSLTSMPKTIDLTAGTDFQYAWYGCTSLASFPALTFSTDADDDIRFDAAWQDCTSLTSFPALNLSRGINLSNTWQNCTGLTSFPAATFSTHADDDVNFNSTWRACSGLTSFPALNLSRGTYFGSAWRGCSNASFTSFPAVTFSSHADDDINFTNTWDDCRFTSFPALNLSRGTNFTDAWKGNTAMTSFGACTFSTHADDDINFTQAWYLCTQLESFPALNLSRGTNFTSAWQGCTDASFTSFPVVTFSTTASDDINFTRCWQECTSLTSFPSVNLSRGTNFYASWYLCSSLVSFPALDLSSGTDFGYCWLQCTSLVSFPSGIDVSSGTVFQGCWHTCSALTTFPAGVFDDWNPASVVTNCFDDAWLGCNALTEQSVENILLSISASGVYPTSDATASGTLIANREITIGASNSNVNVDNLTPATRAACTALQSRGWVVVINGSVVSEYALSFNGSDEYVDCGDPMITGTGDFTYSVWVKPAAVDGDIGGNYGTGNTGGVQFFYQATGKFTVYIGAFVESSAYTVVDKWYHVAYTRASGSVTIYVNGVADGTGTLSGSIAGDHNFLIGVQTDTNYFDGDIDEVAIWDAALDADAVAAVYNSGSPINLNQNKGNYDNSGDIVSWWRMGDNDSGAGNFVSDVVATDGEALHLPGVAANYASVPDAADLDGFTNFTLEAKGVTFADWTPSADQGLMSKYVTGTNSRSWRFELDTTGVLYVILSFDGTATVQYTSTAATGLAAGVTADLMAIRNGVDVRFYVNGVQLGTDVTCVTTALHNSTSTANIGLAWNTDGHPMDGSMQRARVWNSAVANQATPTETPVLDMNFTLANKGWTSFTATSGQVVTINSTSIPNPAAIRSATDGVLVNTPTFVVDNPPNYSNYSLEFDGVNEYVDCGAISEIPSATDLTVSAWVKDEDTTANMVLFGDDTSATEYFSVEYWGSNNRLYFEYGVGTYAYADLRTYVSDNVWHHFALVYDGGGAADADKVKIYINGVATSLTFTGTTPTALSASIGDLWIGDGAKYDPPFNGSIDEFAIWDSALTSAQINDIYNGGVPAALTSLSPLGWWRMGENNAGAGTTITDEGSGENDGTFVNTPTFERSVPAEDATWNNRSILFNGSSHSMTTTADDTLATKSYSFWAKSTETGGNPIFDHGDYNIGAFHFNWSSSRAIIHLGDVYVYFDDHASQDDGNWHHHVVYIEHDDITACKWYIDGVANGTQTGDTVGSAAAYTTGIRLGRGGSNYFDGNLDEFAVFDGELTPAQVLQIYNGGKPADLKEFSPESWWRMGDDDDAGGTTIRDLGAVPTPELITGFTNGVTYPFDTLTTSGRDISSAIKAEGNYAGCVSNPISVVAGEVYEVRFNLTYNSGPASFRVGLENSTAGVDGTVRSNLVYLTTSGEQVIDLVVTDTDSTAYLGMSGAATSGINFSATNISLRKRNLVLNGRMEIDDHWNDFSSPTTNERSTTQVYSGTYSRKCVADSGSDGLKSDTFSVVAGTMYEVSLYYWLASGGAAGKLLARLQNGDGNDVDASHSLTATNTWTKYTFYTTATITGSSSYFKVLQNGSGASTFYLDNVSVRAVNGNPGTLVNTPTFSTDTP